MAYVNQSIVKKARAVSIIQVVVGSVSAIFFCYFFFASFFFVEWSMKLIGAAISALLIAVSILTVVKGYRLLKIVLVVTRYGAAIDVLPKPLLALSSQMEEDEEIILRRVKGMIDAGYLTGLTFDNEQKNIISL